MADRLLERTGAGALCAAKTSERDWLSTPRAGGERSGWHPGEGLQQNQRQGERYRPTRTWYNGRYR